MLTIELREANAALLAAQRKTAEAQEIANQKALDEQRQATQKILSAMTKPALSNVTVKI